MGKKEVLSIASILKAIVLCFVCRGVLGCPAINVTLDRVLEDNPHLVDINQRFEGSGGLLSDEGLKTLLLKLIFRTACPSPAETELNGHGNEKHDIDHITRKQRERDNHGSEGSDHEHITSSDTHENVDKMNAKMIEPDIKHSYESKLKKAETEKIMESHLNKEDESASAQVTKDCIRLEDVISLLRSREENPLTPESFFLLCPAILDTLLRPLCRKVPEEVDYMAMLSANHDHDHHEHDHDHHKHELELDHDHNHQHLATVDSHMTKDAWIAAISSMVLIGLIALACILLIPILKRSRYYVLINHFLLSLAVGSLAGDALIHLLPHAMSMDVNLGLNEHLLHGLYGFAAFCGILLFLLMEKLHNLIGHHKHGHGHGHEGQSSSGDDDELIKEIGAISGELNNDPSKNFDKIGEKLSKHSNHTSFIFTDGNAALDTSRDCFESCPPNLKQPLEDANGNSGNIASMVVCKPRPVDHVSASVAECERLVNNSTLVKLDQVNHSKSALTTIPPPPLMQNGTSTGHVRKDSNSFNMVLQEYHVGHHGHSHHGHSHVTGKKDSLRTMILLGDGMHTFMDGMAIGAAFGTSLTGGIATAVAVLCHELPHKVGDFAILFEMGMRRRQAVKMVIVLWILSVVGLALGVTIGSIEQVSPWIYCFTAGVFLYLALVDLLSEVSIDNSVSCSSGGQIALQVAGMLTGAGIMLVIAIYEHDLQELLEGLL